MSTEILSARFGALIRHNTVLLARDPGQVLGYTLVPVLLITALRPLYVAYYGEVRGTAYITTGALVLFSLITLNVIGHNLLNERSWRTWDRLRATPATGAELLFGKSVPFYVLLLLQQFLLLGYSRIAFGLVIHGSPAALTGMMFVWPAAVVALGNLLAAWARSHGQLNTINDVGAFVVTVISGGLTPLKALPDWMRAVAPFSPGYWALTGLRAAIEGGGPDTLAYPILIVALFAIATAGLAVWTVTRKVGVSQPP